MKLAAEAARRAVERAELRLHRARVTTRRQPVSAEAIAGEYHARFCPTCAGRRGAATLEPSEAALRRRAKARGGSTMEPKCNTF